MVMATMKFNIHSKGKKRTQTNHGKCGVGAFQKYKRARSWLGRKLNQRIPKSRKYNPKNASERTSAWYLNVIAKILHKCTILRVT
jgi:hypothetical protein